MTSLVTIITGNAAVVVLSLFTVPHLNTAYSTGMLVFLRYFFFFLLFLFWLSLWYGVEERASSACTWPVTLLQTRGLLWHPSRCPSSCDRGLFAPVLPASRRLWLWPRCAARACRKSGLRNRGSPLWLWCASLRRLRLLHVLRRLL